MEIDINILRTINAIMTPIALFLSFFLVGFALRALHNSYKKENKIVAGSLLGVGVIFFFNAAIISLTYFVIFTSNNKDVVNLLSNAGIFISNILTIVTSMILIGIYRNKI